MFTADDVLTAVHGTMGKDVEVRFRQFVRSTHATEWHIAADFVTGDGQSAKDAFAFTVFPHDNEFGAILREIRRAGAKDFKEVREVAEPMLRYLRDPRRFHLCFLLAPARHRSITRSHMRALIDGTVELVEAFRDAEAQQQYVKALKGLRQEAKANGFRVKLMTDISLTACFAAMIAFLIAKHGHADVVGWFPDRDAMTSGYKGIIHSLFALNFSALCQRHGVYRERTRLHIGVPGEAERDGGPLWFDDFVRIPDHIAGTMARLDHRANLIPGHHAKYRQVLERVIADNPNVANILVDFSVFGVRASQLAVASAAEGGQAVRPYTSPAALLDFFSAGYLELVERYHCKLGVALRSTSSLTTIDHVQRRGYAPRF